MVRIPYGHGPTVSAVLMCRHVGIGGRAMGIDMCVGQRALVMARKRHTTIPGGTTYRWRKAPAGEKDIHTQDTRTISDVHSDLSVPDS